MENIHIAKLKARLQNAVQQDLAVKLGTMMRGDVHDNHRFLKPRLLFHSGLRLDDRLRVRLRGDRLRRLNGLRSGRRLYVPHGLDVDRLLRYGCRGRLWLSNRLVLLRLWLTHGRSLARLRRLIWRLILVRRLTRRILPAHACFRRMINPVNANFTYAFYGVVI
jgi:hypothetical protein